MGEIEFNIVLALGTALTRQSATLLGHGSKTLFIFPTARLTTQ